MQKSFLLDIVVPHDRRSVPYSMGPENEDEMNDPIEYFVPDFSDEKGLAQALDVVHKRFLTEYGGQRFDDPASELAPDILAVAKEWAEWKSCGISVQKNEDNNGVQVSVPVSNIVDCGFDLEISDERRTSQNLVVTTSATLNAVPGYLPPFFTASELRGALDIAFDVLKQR